MFVYPEKTQSHKGPAEIGPRPWRHRSDCFICRKQEGLETPPTGGYIVEGKYFLAEHAPLKMSPCGNGNNPNQTTSSGFWRDDFG
jgi:hypothetical protein